MTYKSLTTEYYDIEKKIAKLYLYLLPIRMISGLSFLQSFFKGAAFFFDLVLHFLGFSLIVYRARGRFRLGRERSDKMMQSFAKLIVYLNLSSVCMACIIQVTRGSYAGESAFSGILGMFVYFTQYAFMFFYNKHIFRMLTKEEILKILRRVSVFLLGLGYLQIAAYLMGGIFVTIHNRLDIFGVLVDPLKMPKLSLTGSEGASAGVLISTFVFPLIYASILVGDKVKRNVLQAILWLPVLYFTDSTTGYVMFAVITVFFLIKYIGKMGKTKGVVIFVTICGIILFLLFFGSIAIALLPQEMTEKIRYLLFEKIFDKNNGSTVARTIPFITNWGAFTEYPLFGVGNGLQGYFYVKYFPDWGYNAVGSDALIFLQRAEYTIVNGALFFPSLLSGYGIVGTIVVFVFAVRFFKFAKSGKEQMGIFYFIFLIASVGVLVSGFQSEICGDYAIWFMLSLPLMIRGEREE